MTETYRLLDIPDIASIHDAAHGWMYEAVHRLEEANRLQILGNTDETPSVQELLVRKTSRTHHESHWVLAVRGPDEAPKPLGWAYVHLPIHEDLDKATIYVCVDPEARRQGIGSALLRWCEEVVAATGRTLLVCEALYGPAEDQEPYVTTAEGALVPRDAVCVAFGHARGYDLAHAARRSVLDLPVNPQLAAGLMAETLPYTTGYRLHTWYGEIPQEWIGSFARLKEAFTRDAPMGTIQWDEPTWDHARVDEMIREIADQGNAVLMTVAECVETSELVGFTEFRWTDTADVQAASQWFTIVAGQHRGHRLGMWMKLVNAAELTRRRPGIRRVHTDNAQENGPMLSINIRMGFRPNGGAVLLRKSLPTS